jgi:hypothetical protein
MSAIESAYIEFHSTMDFPIRLNDFEQDDYFAILRMKMAKTPIIQTPLFLLFSIDKTASMDEFVDPFSKKTKFDYLKQAFRNILYFLLESKATIFIKVHSFDIEVDITIKHTNLTSENIEGICLRIEELIAQGSTDMGLALSYAEICLTNYQEQNPTHRIVHIFMTDGQAVTGITDFELLSDYVNTNYFNLFFGIGNQHNAYLLRKFSQKKNTEYRFIDRIENMGLIFGETIHRILYPAIEMVKCVIENGGLYNWKTDTWTDTIEDISFMSETEKVFHIRSKSPNFVCVHIFGIDCSLSSPPPSPPHQSSPHSSTISLDEHFVNVTDNHYESVFLKTVYPLPMSNLLYSKTDLTNYLFRQKIQELLFWVSETMIGGDSENGSPPLSTYYSKIYNQRMKVQTDKCKRELKRMFGMLRRYMREHNLLEDSFYLLLCDDIYVTYNTIDTRYGYMYIVSRQTSQGSQQSYITAASPPTSPHDNGYHRVETSQSAENSNGVPLKRQTTEHMMSQWMIPIENDSDNSTFLCPTSLYGDDMEYIEENTNRIGLTLDNPLDMKERGGEWFQFDNYDDIDDIEMKEYIPLEKNTSCYATSSCIRTMNTISEEYYEWSAKHSIIEK